MCITYHYTYTCNHTDTSRHEQCNLSRLQPTFAHTRSSPDPCPNGTRHVPLEIEQPCPTCTKRQGINRTTRERAMANALKRADRAARDAAEVEGWDRERDGPWGRRVSPVTEASSSSTTGSSDAPAQDSGTNASTATGTAETQPVTEERMPRRSDGGPIVDWQRARRERDERQARERERREAQQRARVEAQRTMAAEIQAAMSDVTLSGGMETRRASLPIDIPVRQKPKTEGGTGKELWSERPSGVRWVGKGKGKDGGEK